MLDLRQYFFPEDKYVIIRMDSKFPDYDHYSDVDIVCKPTHIMAAKIKERHKGRLREHFPEGHHHLDYHNEKGLDLKFDLIETFVHFKRVKVSPLLTDALLENSILVKRADYFWRVPTPNYETLVRYLEWLEHPKKKKHKEYFDKNRNQVVDSLIREFSS